MTDHPHRDRPAEPVGPSRHVDADAALAELATAVVASDRRSPEIRTREAWDALVAGGWDALVGEPGE